MSSEIYEYPSLDFLTIQFTYLVPVHNEEKVLAGTVARLVKGLQPFPGSRILLLENGSSDRSKTEVARLSGEYGTVSVRGWTSEVAGLGLAYRRGVEEALAQPDHWIVFGAADLPFDLSDIESFLARRRAGCRAKVATGSKFHEASEVARPAIRTLLSHGFRLGRRIILGMRTRDCQGSVIIHASALAMLQDYPRSATYFFTTELIYFAERMGFEVVELPVRYAGEKRRSTVRPLYHSLRMLKELAAFGWRERARPLPRLGHGEG